MITTDQTGKIWISMQIWLNVMCDFYSTLWRLHKRTDVKLVMMGFNTECIMHFLRYKMGNPKL